MRDKDFNELLESIREGGDILRGEGPASRVFEMPEPDVSRIRKEMHLSQQDFAAAFGISVRTLQEWEQGRRTPDGPARVLLHVAQREPEAVARTVAQCRKQTRPAGREARRRA